MGRGCGKGAARARARVCDGCVALRRAALARPARPLAPSPALTLVAHDAPHVAVRAVGDVRVGEEDVRVRVVADDVLVVPRDHGAAGVPVLREAPDGLPVALVRADGRVARVVHGVQQRHDLEDAEEQRGGGAQPEGQARRALGHGGGDEVGGQAAAREQRRQRRAERPQPRDAVDADGEGREADADLQREAPHARPQLLRRGARRGEVRLEAGRELVVEARRVGCKERVLRRALERADLERLHLALHAALAVHAGHAPVVRAEEVRALAARGQQQHLLAARMVVEERREVVHAAVHRDPAVLRRVVRRHLREGERALRPRLLAAGSGGGGGGGGRGLRQRRRGGAERRQRRRGAGGVCGRRAECEGQ